MTIFQFIAGCRFLQTTCNNHLIGAGLDLQENNILELRNQNHLNLSEANY